MSKQKGLTFYGFFIWTLAILFFFYEFFLRVLPATIAKNIISSLDMSIEQFAFVGSAYYLTYSLMQIPVGLLLDRFKVRPLITAACGLCCIGTLLFSIAGGVTIVFIARLLIGLGSSFGFVGLMIVTLNWFPKSYFAFLVGCGQFLGALGPLAAGGPIALMLAAFNGNWRLIFTVFGIFGVGLSVLIGVFLRGKPINTEKVVFVDRKSSLKERVKALCKQKEAWLVFAYAATIYFSLPLLGAFWGTSYLESMGFDKSPAAFIVSMIWLGLAIGSPLFGKLSDGIKRRKPVLALCALVGAISGAALLAFPLKNELYLGMLFFFIGVAGSGQNLSFATISEFAPKNLQATGLALNNTFVMGFAAIAPPIVTFVIGQYTTSGSQPSEAAFAKGFLVIPIAYAIAFCIATFGIKETFCRHQNSVHTLRRES